MAKQLRITMPDGTVIDKSAPDELDALRKRALLNEADRTQGIYAPGSTGQVGAQAPAGPMPYTGAGPSTGLAINPQVQPYRQALAQAVQPAQVPQPAPTASANSPSGFTNAPQNAPMPGLAPPQTPGMAPLATPYKQSLSTFASGTIDATSPLNQSIEQIRTEGRKQEQERRFQHDVDMQTLRNKPQYETIKERATTNKERLQQGAKKLELEGQENARKAVKDENDKAIAEQEAKNKTHQADLKANRDVIQGLDKVNQGLLQSHDRNIAQAQANVRQARAAVFANINAGQNAEGLQNLYDRRDEAEKSLDEANAARDTFKQQMGFRTANATGPERTATNPQTGQKMVFRNNQWIPA